MTWSTRRGQEAVADRQPSTSTRGNRGNPKNTEQQHRPPPGKQLKKPWSVCVCVCKAASAPNGPNPAAAVETRSQNESTSRNRRTVADTGVVLVPEFVYVLIDVVAALRELFGCLGTLVVPHIRVPEHSKERKERNAGSKGRGMRGRSRRGQVDSFKQQRRTISRRWLGVDTYCDSSRANGLRTTQNRSGAL